MARFLLATSVVMQSPCHYLFLCKFRTKKQFYAILGPKKRAKNAQCPKNIAQKHPQENGAKKMPKKCPDQEFRRVTTSWPKFLKPKFLERLGCRTLCCLPDEELVKDLDTANQNQPIYNILYSSPNLPCCMLDNFTKRHKNLADIVCLSTFLCKCVPNKAIKL